MPKVVKKKKPARSRSTFAVSIPKSRNIVLPTRQDINQPPSEFLDYTTLLYGAKGVGKTTATASFPDCLNISFEPRRRNVAHRRYPIIAGVTARQIIERRREDPEYMDPWTEFCCVIEMALNDPTIRTIAVDSVDIAYECCQEFICAEKGIDNPSDKSDGGNTWNQLKFMFIQCLRAVIDADDKALLLISHAKERELELMDGIDNLKIVAPSCPPACLKIMKQVCDFWFYYTKIDGKRQVIVRDEDQQVEVACGNGFLDADGNEITHVEIPKGVESFYPAINQAYHGGKAKPSVAKAKRAVKRKIPKRPA